MWTLIIDTSAEQESLAIFEGKTKRASLAWKGMYDETEVLLPNIGRLLKKLRLSFHDLNRIAVCEGAGTFTALRIGVTVANTLAFALGIPLFAFQTGKSGMIRKRVAVPRYHIPPNITKPKP